MAPSETAICNFALSLFGDRRINSIDEATETANLCKLWYEQCRDELLSVNAADWTFARGRAELTATTTPDFNWDYAYTLPADFLRLRRHTDEWDAWIYTDIYLYYSLGDIPTYPFTIEGGNLLSNKSDCQILYIKKITDVAKYPPPFTAAFYTLLASRLSPRISLDRSKPAELLQMYEQDALPKAIAFNNSNSYVEDEEGNNSWTTEGR